MPCCRSHLWGFPRKLGRRYALSEGVSLQDVLAQVHSVNPGAMESALTSSFNVVEDKLSVVTAAIEAKVDTVLVVTTPAPVVPVIVDELDDDDVSPS